MAESSQARTENPTQSGLYQLSGVAAMLGGGLIVALAVATAAMPRGCIAEECAYRPMRESLFGTEAIFALVLIVAGAVGLLVRTRRAGRFGKLGWAGLISVSASLASLATGVVVLNSWDSSLVPAFVISGGLLLVLGFLLMGITVLMSGMLARWAAVVLVVGTVAMLGFNDQTWRALMAVPFGIAWAVVGYTLWSHHNDASGQRTRE